MEQKSEGLNLNGKRAAPQVVKVQTGDFQNQSGTPPLNGFCQAPLDVPPGILEALKRGLNRLAHTAQQPVKFGPGFGGLEWCVWASSAD